MASDDETVDAKPVHLCQGCGKEAAMACPQCVKLKKSEPAGFACEGFGVVYFCTQECFKACGAAASRHVNITVSNLFF